VLTVPRERKSLKDHALQSTKPEWTSPDVSLAPGRPNYPKGISPAAKRTFKRLCAILEKRRNLTEGDSELLRLYAIAYDRHAKAVQKLAAEGEIRMYERESKTGDIYSVEKENLWLPVLTNAEKFMRGCLADLGLNPLNRTKIKQTEVPKSASPEHAAEEALMSREAAALVNDEPNLDDIDETLIQ
jgi:P27 family predicted phage terminase small subunit